MTPLHSLLASLLLAFATVSAFAQVPEIETSLPLQQVLVGASALLNIQVPGEEATGALTTNQPSSLTFEALGADYLNRRVFCGNIGVTSEQVGIFEIPAFNIPLESGTVTSTPLLLEVFPLDNIQWRSYKIDNKTYEIGIIILHPTGTIYEGQSIPLTAKVIIPSDLPVRSTGYAEIEKDNIGAWRMETPMPPNYNQPQGAPRPPHALRPREALLEGKLYQIINYVSFAAPLKSGPVTVGPGKIQGLQVTVTSSQQSRGFFGRVNRSYNIEFEIPKTSFQAAALPKGAPSSFNGAIGDFSLDAAIDTTAELKSGDPVIVQLRVSGHGNIDTLPAPTIDAPESNWKLYPPSRNEQEGDRRTNQGMAAFSQILRPLVPIKEIPPYLFTFFNPKTTKYETLRSEPIPLSLAPLTNAASSGGTKAGLVPIAEMSDILGLIEPKPFQARKPFRIGAAWQILPALITLALLALVVKRQLPRFTKNNPDKTQLQQELKAIEAEKDDSAFLRHAANFAESRGFPHDEFLSELLNERDASCFQPGETASPVPSDRRSAILRTLHERANGFLLLTALLLVCQPFSAEASFQEQAQQAWEEGQYEEARNAYELILKDGQTPDLLYNIGSCYYRLDQPARAALFYRRAILLEPSHPEAKQNLAFIERKLGAIPIPPDDTPAWAQKLTYPYLKNLLAAALWLFVIALLARFAVPSHRIQKLSTTGVFVSSILLVVLGLIWFLHPGAAEPRYQADSILIAEKSTELRTEPTSGGSIILNANPSTSCKIISQRNQWSYVELPSKTRGWFPSELLEKI